MEVDEQNYRPDWNSTNENECLMNQGHPKNPTHKPAGLNEQVKNNCLQSSDFNETHWKNAARYIRHWKSIYIINRGISCKNMPNQVIWSDISAYSAIMRRRHLLQAIVSCCFLVQRNHFWLRGYYCRKPCPPPASTSLQDQLAIASILPEREN